MPGVDFRQPQFFPGVFERAERCFRCEPLAPTALHEMEPDFEIRLAGRIEPRPKSAAADELAIAVSEQRSILNATGPLPLDLGAELLSDLGIGEFAAGINERRDGGIPPQFHRKGQILDLPWPRHKALGPEFFRFPHDRRREWPYSCASQRYRRRWDREFESGLLQRRVNREPNFLRTINMGGFDRPNNKQHRARQPPPLMRPVQRGRATSSGCRGAAIPAGCRRGVR